ncbi:hypothetical protein [Methylobacterium sp. JK268]
MPRPTLLDLIAIALATAELLITTLLRMPGAALADLVNALRGREVARG